MAGDGVQPGSREEDALQRELVCPVRGRFHWAGPGCLLGEKVRKSREGLEYSFKAHR